jgi:cysteinyl-tRNA synthetase, unknown class
MPLLKKGVECDEVETLQETLGIDVDGTFGAATDAAVKAWQSNAGLAATGVADPVTLLAMGLEDLIELEVGDKGDFVKTLQTALGLKADGIYGKSTEKAVDAYQEKNGLDENGNANAETLRHLGLIGDSEGAAPAPVAKVPAARTPVAAPIAAPRASTKAAAASAPTSGPASGGTISSWAYQLADIDPAEIAKLPVDLVVVDYAADGSAETEFKPADVAVMRQRPDGGTKKVISYMSIGEAEDYRFYWNPAWAKTKTKPEWLDELNPDWEGNFKVRYWDPAWQAVILGSPDAYLDKIIAAGFDGVYLDIIDAFEYWKDEKSERDTADRDMIAFVQMISSYARSKRAGFMIIPQNGEALLEDADYRAAISAQAKEDVFYGADGDGKPNKSAAVSDVLDNLKYARDAGIPILAIEYLDDTKKIADAKGRLETNGCCSYFGPRDLASISLKGIQST